ncbi:MAG: ABC-F family ATP-binding cassette domain-containing protein, partial [Syntrophomonadaceae bacterium]|nr:ABC-F family ATP-binding cassette domain-containing protein [Syntrophomonadaceae bacterium]
TKLALAGVWASRPDLIILDEPTNHMDYQGVKYLISELASYQGAVIIISHDRYFLDQTVAQIAELENGHIRIYKGNYSAYREAKRRDRESRQHVYESQQKEQRKVEIAVTKLKTWSAKAHRESRHKGDGQMGGKEYFRKKAKKRDQAVKSQLKRLEKMSREQVERPGKELRVNFDLNAGGKGARRLLEASEISKAFGDLVLFKDSSFYINRGEKVGILGPNGCGKTTLIKTILGEETVDRGAIFLSPAARIAYVGQELPRGKEGTLQELVATWTREQQKRAFQLMIQLGIPYDRLSIAMGELSRGERMKIAMGLAIMGECDLLILDEPTNHLDLYSREALEESLTQFPGTTMIISHDRYLLQEVCQYLLVFDQQKVSRIEGKLEYYLTKRPLDKDSFESQTPAEPDNQEELLLLETKIAWILSELNRIKPGTSDYLALDQEYTRLARRKNELRPTRR